MVGGDTGNCPFYPVQPHYFLLLPTPYSLLLLTSFLLPPTTSYSLLLPPTPSYSLLLPILPHTPSYTPTLY